jgi:hypothetical protein
MSWHDTRILFDSLIHMCVIAYRVGRGQHDTDHMRMPCCSRSNKYFLQSFSYICFTHINWQLKEENGKEATKKTFLTL